MAFVPLVSLTPALGYASVACSFGNGSLRAAARAPLRTRQARSFSSATMQLSEPEVEPEVESVVEPVVEPEKEEAKIFVGNLSWNTTGDMLREVFEEFGTVLDARVVMDRETGRSRGYGFITFESPEGAAAAINETDGSALDGRQIRVNRANKRPRRETLRY